MSTMIRNNRWTISAYLVAFVVFAWMVTEQKAVSASVDRIILADNLTMAFCQLCIATMIGNFLWSECRFRVWEHPLHLSLFGVIVEAIGWATHRMYWSLWRLMRELGLDDVAAKLEDTTALWTVCSFALIALGAILIVSPVSRRIFGSQWPAWSLAITSTFYLGAYHVPDLVRASHG
ncbi:MAG: hypothetical protein RIC14_05745 [Filomicrobium sp.]